MSKMNDKRDVFEQLTQEEIRKVARVVRQYAKTQPPRAQEGDIRFNVITLKEPSKKEVKECQEGKVNSIARNAFVVIQHPKQGTAIEAIVSVDVEKILSWKALSKEDQPLLSPDDCALAESIVKSDSELLALLKDRYGIASKDDIVCDPWSIHVAAEMDHLTKWRKDGIPSRLVQLFLYSRENPVDNHYAHPLDVLPVVDLNGKKVIHVDKQLSAPKVPKQKVNYHPSLLGQNSYLPKTMREDAPKALEILQPNGPSFTVTGNKIVWQKWSLTISFNYREGLVLHDVHYEGRPVLNRASLVEMAVPYGDPHEPFHRKCAFDVGDYGLGYCTDSLELGCDCLGHIHYFDGILADSKGEPYCIKKAICMHEEDDGLLWKHVEYRTGHSESRRSRKLVLSFIATVVNYEYLFYWYLGQDGSISLEIKLSGELSTNLLSYGESEPGYGVLAAPGVNAQVHQHYFCARLDMSVDGPKNSVCEIDVVPVPDETSNPFGNAFTAKKTLFKNEKSDQGMVAPQLARTWQILNPEKLNPITGKPVSYKLVPYTYGPAQPMLITKPTCAVTKRGQFATKSIWVTKYDESEFFPAGDYTVQSAGGKGLPEWVEKQRNIENEDIVVWHSFGVVHVPRVEDFPVMPCETTGFTLKPDGFFCGNPGIDIPDTVSTKSTCCSHHGVNGTNGTNGTN